MTSVYLSQGGSREEKQQIPAGSQAGTIVPVVAMSTEELWQLLLILFLFSLSTPATPEPLQKLETERQGHAGGKGGPPVSAHTFTQKRYFLIKAPRPSEHM